MKRFRKLTMLVCVAITCIGLVFAWRQASIQASIRHYDAAFDRIQRGQAAADVVTLFGPPHERTKGWTYPRDVKVFYIYIYRVERPRRPPVKWTIGVDSAGLVVSKHRAANGC